MPKTKTRYEAIDSDGMLHWRNSAREYGYCVVDVYSRPVVYGAANPQYKNTNKRVSWAGTRHDALARAKATPKDLDPYGGYEDRTSPLQLVRVEILEAKRV